MRQEVSEREGFVSRSEAAALSAMALLLHGALFWLLFLQTPAVPVVVPQMASVGEERAVTMELSGAPAASDDAPSAPEEQPMPEPVPEPPAVQEDERAVRPPPEKREVRKTEARPKPKPQRQIAREAPSSRSRADSQTAGTTAGAAKRPADGGAGESVTPAVSGLKSLGNPEPPYPPLALRRQEEGSVTLRILVLENGRAGEVIVTRSSRSALLDRAAVETVKNQWRFIPAKRGNKAIKGYAVQTITFRLPG